MDGHRTVARRALTFSALVVETPIVAYAFSVVLLLAIGADIGGALLLALWVTAPVLWWTGYALVCGRGTSAHQGAVILLAVPLLLLQVVWQLSIVTSPTSDDSLADLAFLVTPFVLLLGTIIATVISALLVAKSNRRSAPAAG